MKKRTLVIMLTVVLALPFTTFAMKDMGHGEHGKQKAMDHGGMAMEGEMIMLQDHEVDGVMGSAHLMDVKEKMAEHGMSMTHHIMVSFMDTEGNPIDHGSVAVKVESPDESVGKPVKMMGMDGAFGADITLNQQGMYHFKIGTKLPDGKKRTFHFHHQN